jgi:hypothetical protein
LVSIAIDVIPLSSGQHRLHNPFYTLRKPIAHLVKRSSSPTTASSSRTIALHLGAPAMPTLAPRGSMTGATRRLPGTSLKEYRLESQREQHFPCHGHHHVLKERRQAQHAQSIANHSSPPDDEALRSAGG